MRNFDLEQNISDANASGREHSFAPRNICCNPSFDIKNVPSVKSENSGRSMIEMLGVLAIIGVLSVGGIAGYSKAMMKYRINKTIEQITLIAGNIRTFFASQGNYKGLSSNNDTGKSIIKKAKLVPDEMLTITNGKITGITNAFGGGVGLGVNDKIFSWDTYGHFDECDSFYIYSSFNEEVCIELLTQNWAIANVSFIEAYGGAYDNGISLPASVDDAVEACSTAKPDNNMINMIFFFDVDINSWKEGYDDIDKWY